MYLIHSSAIAVGDIIYFSGHDCGYVVIISIDHSRSPWFISGVGRALTKLYTIDTNEVGQLHTIVYIEPFMVGTFNDI